ncbi:junctional adhesion molecule 2A-like [Leptopilina boulardi]|uniref:junctional adhesion molecule 2A-like n=1 Tax=Leptopilina boulardi TaxID=63433 RepID=UPI0021F63A45|nr:junctional adhesion molecule 2A-like [Leptopilina boulardi]
MPRQQANWKQFLFIFYILLLFSYATCTLHVQLVAPHYVEYHTDATLICTHNVSDESNLRKVEFYKDNKKIFQYISDRSPPFNIPNKNSNLEHSSDGKTITLKKVTFSDRGMYSCEVSTLSPIFETESKQEKLEVIVPQTGPPVITLDKSIYVVGEFLEGNCSSSPTAPAPSLTWYINEKRVPYNDIIMHPHQKHNNNLMSSSIYLKTKITELLINENNELEINCRGTIPEFNQYGKFADERFATEIVQVIPAPTIHSSSKRLTEKLSLIIITSVLCAVQKMIPL